MTTRLFAVAALASSLLACAPADVSGDYTMSVTNRENGCNFSNWTVGASTSNVPVTVTQNGATATITINGITAAVFLATLGANGNVFNGNVTGTRLQATRDGTVSATQGACAYTLRAVINAELSGNTLNGTIAYTALTNGHADCGALSSCVSSQAFAGVRPPR